jgi:hypothetical protein
MATVTVTPGYQWTSGETVTPTKLNSAAEPTVTAAVADNEITTSKILDGAVTTGKIASGAVSADKLTGVVTIDAKTANYTLVLADAGKIIEVNSASNLTVTVPTDSTAAFAVGATVAVSRRGAGDVTIAGASGVTLRSADSKAKIGKQFAAVALIKIATNEWLLLGSLKT